MHSDDDQDRTEKLKSEGWKIVENDRLHASDRGRCGSGWPMVNPNSR